VRQILHNGIFSANINDEIGDYFQSAKGVRQGYPMSSIMFNMVSVFGTKIVLNAQRDGLCFFPALDFVEN
jgi:hypothetical protein